MQAYIGDIVPMSIADSQKNTYTEICFAGCDFNCPSCNRSWILEFKEEFLVDLSYVKEGIGLAGSLFLTGGEPMIQSAALYEICRFAKERKISVGIDTNGSRPDVLKRLLEGRLVDFVSIDIKSPFEEEAFQKVTRSETFFVKGEKILENVKESLALLKGSDIGWEAKTLIVPGLMFRKEDLLEIAAVLDSAGGAWVLQQFSGEEVKDPRFRDLASPGEEFIRNLKRSCLARFPGMRIRIRLVSS